MISNKKTISFIIAFTLTFCAIAILVGVLVFAQKTVPSTNALTSGVYTYTVSGSSATITDCSTSVSGSLSIPSSLGGYTVTSIGSRAFSSCRNLTSVTIPSSVTSIGNYAFRDCSSLTRVTIPSSVTSIGNYAFRDCTALTSVTIPSSVTSIGSYAFNGCSSLTSMSIPSSVTSIGSSAFKDCTKLTSFSVNSANSYYSSDNYGVLYNKDKTILRQYPAGNTRSSFTIPSTVTSIGSDAFNGCTRLSSVTVPSSVTKINSLAFSYCSSLTSVTIENGVERIEACAFQYCTSLTSFYVPSSVTSIGVNAFDGCTKLASFSVSSSNPNYSSDNYGVLYNKDKTMLVRYPAGNSRTSFTIPSTVNSTYDSSFRRSLNLKSITIPNSVTSIGSSTFSDCTNITTVTIGTGIKKIGDFGFDSCENISSVYYQGNINGWVEIDFGGSNGNPLSYGANLYINNSVVTTANITTATKIGRNAFYRYTKLTSVSIPSSVSNIGSYAFGYCSSLTSVTFYNKLTSASNIESYAFTNGSSSAVYYFAYKSTYDLAVSVGTSKFSSTDFRLMSFNLYTNSSGNGSVNSSINNPIVVGTQVTLTAEPNTGYHLEKWTDANGNQLSTNTTYTHMIDGGDATITAHFLVNTYTIVYNSNKPSGASGEVTGSTANSTHTYGVGKNLTTNGYQLAKYNFKGWATSPNGAVQYSDGQNVTNLSATNGATVNLYAVWELIVFTITVQVTPKGAGSVNGAGTYQVGEEVKLTAVPSGAYRFAYWADEQGNELSTNNPYTFNIEENLTVIANFELVTYNLTIKVNDASLGNVLYNNQVTSNLSISQTVNTQLNIFALANTGVAFLYWEVAENNTTVTQSSNSLVHILTSDCTITAVFGSGMVDGLAVTSRGGGQVRMGGYEDDGTDSTVNLYAVSYTDYQFDGWYIMQNGVETKLEQFGNSTAISISVQDYDGKLIIAKFKLIKNDYANLEVDNS